MRKMLILLFSCFFVFSLHCEESVQYRSTTEIIADLRAKTDELVKTNEELAALNKADKDTITELSDRIKTATESIDKAAADLSEANEKIIRQDEKIKFQKNILLTLTIILALLVVAHIVVLILNFKFGITLPYWLNALL